MNITKSELPIVDWDQETKLAQTASGLTLELLNMFARELPEARHTINQAYAVKDYKKLNDRLHKLQGGCVYCGLLRLKVTITEVTESIHNNTISQLHMDELNNQMDAVTNELSTKGISC